MSKILITGATSEIGVFLLPILQKNFKNKIVAISRKKKKSTEDIIWLQYDIRNDNLDQLKVHNIKQIIHLAEIPLIENILNVTKDIRRIIAFSSTSLLTKKESNNIEDKTLANELAAGEERLIYLCSKRHINYTILRPTLIYGADMDLNVAFITNFIKKFHFFPILGEGSGLRQPVHALDLAKVSLDIINNEKTFNNTYILNGGETIKYSVMIDKIFESIEKKKITIKIPFILFYSLIRLLKWHPKYNHLTTGMVDRLNENLCFDNIESVKDFNYYPMNFIPNKHINNV